LKRILFSVITIVCLLGVIGFAAGVFTPEIVHEESCPLCRAIKQSGHRYGFGFTHVEDVPFTEWYRQNIDPDHGLDPGHPHVWLKSGCTLQSRVQSSAVDEDCTWIPAVFLIRPEVELAVLRQLPDRDTKLGLLKSLNTDNRADNTRRVRLLVEYYFVARDKVTWSDWWRANAREFGLSPVEQPVRK